MSRLKYTSRPEQAYLDEQPEIQAVIRDFMADIEPDYPEGYESGDGPEEINCRRRDGFIPHSHNLGGYDRTWWTTAYDFIATGYELCAGFDLELAHSQESEAYNNFWKYDISDESKEATKDLTEDQKHYHALEELGLSSVANEMDEYVREWMESDPISFGFRAMYEGKESGWHTLCIHASANQCRYWGAFGSGSTSIATIEIKFRNVVELKRKLAAKKSEIDSIF